MIIAAAMSEDFPLHAYNALYSGRVYEFCGDLQRAVAGRVSADLCALVRSFPKEDRDAFLASITSQVRPN